MYICLHRCMSKCKCRYISNCIRVHRHLPVYLQRAPAVLVCCGLQVLSCYAQMASAQEESLEEALKQLLELAGQQRASVPVLLALASGFMLKKQTPKARWACPCKTSAL